MTAIAKSFLSNSCIEQLLLTLFDVQQVAYLSDILLIDPRLISKKSSDSLVSRAELAQALNMVLFFDNLQAVPLAQLYVNEKLASGQKIVFDHGALRTVNHTITGGLPCGELAFKRILEPLGFMVAEIYPLPKLKMTGRAYRHQDFPESIAQFFVSELHVNQFSSAFQEAVGRVVSTSIDPLSHQAKALLEKLAVSQCLAFQEAADLLHVLRRCFAVAHDLPRVQDYELILQESAEMAWICTEGNHFNHATDRVADVTSVAKEQALLGRPIKEKIEISQTGRVRQTAFKAAQALRYLIDEHGNRVGKFVPGSFFEFISRDYLPVETEQLPLLDLSFDTSNAQGIFKMTSNQ